MVGQAFQGRDFDSRPCLIVWLIRTGIFGENRRLSKVTVLIKRCMLVPWKSGITRIAASSRSIHLGCRHPSPPKHVLQANQLMRLGRHFRSEIPIYKLQLDRPGLYFQTETPVRSFRFKSVFNCLLINGHLCTSVAGPRWPFIGRCRVPWNIGITWIAASSRSNHLRCRHFLLSEQRAESKLDIPENCITMDGSIWILFIMTTDPYWNNFRHSVSVGVCSAIAV